MNACLLYNVIFQSSMFYCDKNNFYIYNFYQEISKTNILYLQMRIKKKSDIDINFN